MEILDLNPEHLDATATIIEGYCEKQKALMDEYLASVCAVASSNWSDDETMEPLLEAVRQLDAYITQMMDEIRKTYPAYFRQKADFIRHRPKF